MTMQYDVVSIGSATLDIFVKSSQFKLIKTDEVESGMALCEVIGGKVDVDDIVLATGGGATNTAVSFARKGLKAGCIVEIGKDLPAKLVLQDLEIEGVDVSMVVQESEEKTAMSVILSAGESGRSIVTYRGASGMLGDNDIPWERLFKGKDTRWLYVSSLGGRIEILEKLVRQASENGVKIAVNPGAGELISPEKVLEVAPLMDVLIVNMEETAKLLNLPLQSEKEILSQMKEKGGKVTLVSQGDKGAYVVSKEEELFIPSADVKVAETTGAGDAFGSGFVAGQILGWDVEKSAKLAVANAAGVIQQVGAKKGLINLDG